MTLQSLALEILSSVTSLRNIFFSLLWQGPHFQHHGPHSGSLFSWKCEIFQFESKFKSSFENQKVSNCSVESTHQFRMIINYRKNYLLYTDTYSEYCHHDKNSLICYTDCVACNLELFSPLTCFRRPLQAIKKSTSKAYQKKREILQSKFVMTGFLTSDAAVEKKRAASVIVNL